MTTFNIKTNQSFYKTNKIVYNTTFRGFDVAVVKTGNILPNGKVEVRIMNNTVWRKSCHRPNEQLPQKGHKFYTNASRLRKTRG